MALQSNDVFVIQRQSGGKEHFKLGVQALQDYLNSNASLHYRGTCDLTATSAGQLNPVTPQNGDIYLNTADGVAFGDWPGLTGGDAVANGDRIVYKEISAGFELISGTTNVGVTEVQGSLPITVDSTDPAKPIVEINEATTTDPGHVARLATVADVAADSGTGSTEAVVTADLLKTTNDALEAATAGGVSNIVAADPLVATGTTTVDLSIKDASVGQKGAIEIATTNDVQTGTDTGKAVNSADLAATYLIKDFSTLADA